ncbi:MAG: hypothetical protein FJY85_14510, partial [Deltaproteobacteria bacterium]|nr:hypothetical protein [Deltaproteobacteria bacterium]
MDPIRTKRVPWRSWSDFTGWAQDFSLRQKVLGGFLGVVVLVGLIASLIGTRLARETIINTARVRLHSQLASASYVLRSAQQNVDMKIRLMANSERFAAAVERGDVQEAQNRLAILAVENDLDFLSLTDDKGRTEAKAFVQEVKTNNEAASDAVIIAALKGTSASGVRLVPLQRLVHENPSLSQRLGTVDNKMGMVFESAYPLKLNDKIVGSVYGGIVLNNSGVTDRISQLLFKGEKHAGKDLGSITIYLGNEAISTTLKGPNGLPLFGSPPDSKIFEMVLNKGLKETTWVTQVGTTYLAA